MNSSANAAAQNAVENLEEIRLDANEIQKPEVIVSIKPDVIALEGKGSPDLPLAKGEFVLLDVSQGWRDLGLLAKLARHKGRLIVTNRRALVFTKKTRDYEIQQMRLTHAGYLKMGHRLMMLKLLGAITVIVAGIALMPTQAVAGLVVVAFGVIGLFTARRQGISIFGSGGNLVFDTKSVSHMELSKVLTVLNGAA
ncbi:hypothetical protein [Granulosicoccus antarcticus]|uniref:Uncharacterized protein n=1 Tax=Granulosicoccus antarcticus IMCC3135 TaxID=1192854 RepID=A0A2Z2NM40_9GAMM|nr:hypothetical protein [Granulosicoccus antarcticus]ASJ72239.1 hypothetical protein IMCC3135_10735 [Granulosicoccus antarcticus IMCC3135]